MPNFALVGDRVAVKLDPEESITKGGIVMPDNAKEKSTKGTVVAVGLGKWNDQHFRRNPMSVSVDSRVMVEKYGHVKIEVDGEYFTVVHEEDVLAILPSENGKAKRK